MLKIHTIHAILIVHLCLGTLATATDYPVRTWTNDQGRTIEARLKRFSGSTALLNQNGSEIRAPIARLSDEDKEWIKKVRELRRWREWTMADSSVQRAKLESIEGDTLLLNVRESETELELTLDDLADVDRQLLADVYQAREEDQNNKSGFPSRVGAPSASNVGTVREWTNAKGQRIEAEFRGVEGNKVVLLYKGQERRISLSQLSHEDRVFAMQSAAGMATSSKSDKNRSRFEPRSKSSSRNLVAENKDAARNRMTPGYVGSSQNRAQQMHNEAMARMEAQRKQMEQDRLERERRDKERMAGMDRQREERMASTRTTPSPKLASRPSPPSPKRAIPQPTRPTFTSPTSVPSEPQMQLVNVYQCFSCNRTWESAREYSAGDKCPHCGVRFDAMKDENGRIVDETGSSKARRYGGIIKLVVIGVLALGGMMAKMGRG